MTIARRQLIDDFRNSLVYHLHVTLCSRARCCSSGESSDRKTWLEKRIEELAQIFALGVGGFSVMDNHLHLLLRLDPDVAAGWSNEDVVRLQGRLFPPRDKSRQPLPVSEAWVQARLKDLCWVARVRERLQSIGWFMKCLKEPLSRLANRQDECRGAFFQGRYKSGTETGTRLVLCSVGRSGIRGTIPRTARVALGGQAYHVLNRSTGRTPSSVQHPNAKLSASRFPSGFLLGQEHLLANSLMVGIGRRQVADQCQQRPLVALHEAAERLDVCRQHPPDRIEVVVHGALPALLH